MAAMTPKKVREKVAEINAQLVTKLDKETAKKISWSLALISHDYCNLWSNYNFYKNHYNKSKGIKL